MDESNYRIRWAWISIPERGGAKELRCIPEKSIKLFEKHFFWWPLDNWTRQEGHAMSVISQDKRIHEEPLPKEEYFD